MSDFSLEAFSDGTAEKKASPESAMKAKKYRQIFTNIRKKRNPSDVLGFMKIYSATWTSTESSSSFPSDLSTTVALVNAS